MLSSDTVVTVRRSTVAVAMPGHLREQFFAPSSWEGLARWADIWLLDERVDSLSPPVRRRLADTEILVTGWGTQLVDGAVLDCAPSLRAVIHTGGSVRKIVTPEVYQRGVRVSSQVVNNAIPVAEYTLAMVILALKGVLQSAHAYGTARTSQDVYRLMANHGSYRRTVGIVGASRVGRRVIMLLKALDVDVVVYDPFLDEGDAQVLGVRVVALAELARSSDIVSIHAPSLPETHAMINADFLAQMRDGATIINTARGSLVDEEALISELARGRLHAVLDVTDPEVPAQSSPLWSLPNVLLTPHVAGALGVELQRLGDAAIEEVRRVAAGEPMRYEVTLDSLGMMA